MESSRRSMGSLQAALVAAAVAAFAAPGSVASAASGAWPQYGHDAAHTFRNAREHTITAATVSRLRPAWSRTVVGAMTTPTVADGRVFVVAWGTDEATVSAFAATDGRPLWSHGFAALAPSAQVAVAGVHVYACADGRVHVLGERRGRLLRTGAPCTGPVVIDGSRGLTVGGAGALRAWSVADGRQLWRSPHGLRLLDQAPSVAGGRVYAPGTGADRRNLYVFDEVTGRVANIRRSTPGFQLYQGTSIVGGNLWTMEFQWCLQCADIDGEGYVRAFAVAANVPPEPRFLLTNFANESGTPVVGYGHLIAPGIDTDFERGYPVAPGATAWLSTTAYGTFGVTLAGGVAYSDTCGCAVSPETGDALWSSGAGWGIGPPAIAGGTVYWVKQAADGAPETLRTFRLPG
jgi:outer membrane protein assembly factor BamB